MISTVLFDIGGTLHTVRDSAQMRIDFARRLSLRLADYGIVLDTPYDVAAERLHENAEAYKHWSEQSREELPGARIWNEFYLKEYGIGEDKLEPIAEELSFLYDYDRVDHLRRPRLRETIVELSDMGIRMGIISNIISTLFVPHILKEYGIEEYMECVVMSSAAGCRKPGAEIFNIALNELGVTAKETAYVGDTLSRDVLGTRNAGLGLAIQIRNPAIAHRDAALVGEDAPKPDYLIDELYEIPEIIRSCNQ